MLTLRLDGEENFYRSCMRIERKVEEQSADFLDEMGEFIVSTIRDNWWPTSPSPKEGGTTPAKKTGNLDESIRTDTDYRKGGQFSSRDAANRLYVRFNTEDGSKNNGRGNYAEALETGTYKMAARPFLAPALERAKDIAPYIAQRTFRL